MQLTEAQEREIIEGAKQIVADAILAKLGNEPDELVSYSINRAAGMLDLSSSQLRRSLEEVIDFGPRDGRVSLAQLKRLVAKRTTKRGKAGK